MRTDTIFERNQPAATLVDATLAGSHEACFWLEDAPAPPAGEALSGRQTADLAVVGGGYTGLWTAIRAKERDPGRRVVLLEAHQLGWAASGRNGGFCDASLTHGRDNGLNRWPDEVDRLDALGEANLAGIADTVQRHAMDADFERPGGIGVAVEPHQVDWLREAAAAGEGRFLDEAAVRAEVASPTYLAGLASDGTALLHPAKMVRELARVATELGVVIRENSHVRRLSAEGKTGAVTLVTDRGTLVADRVALGTNVFPALIRRYRPFTIPVYDFVVVTEPLTPAQMGEVGWRGRQGLDDPANQFHYYRLTADNRILFGGYDAVYRYGRRVDPRHEHRPEVHRRLVSHLLTTFPQLEGIRVTHRWAGASDTSTQFCAFYGTAHGGRAAHAAGFTGLGVGATRFAADVLLDLLSGVETERTTLQMVRRMPLPFPPEPVASLAVNATRWSLDRADHRQGDRNLWLRTLDRLGLGFDS
ncbi:MAG: FAD-dependent oxidoreductase [Nostocoides sp.]